MENQESFSLRSEVQVKVLNALIFEMYKKKFSGEGATDMMKKLEELEKEGRALDIGTYLEEKENDKFFLDFNRLSEDFGECFKNKIGEGMQDVEEIKKEIVKELLPVALSLIRDSSEEEWREAA